MAVTVTAEPIDRDIELMLSESLSPKEQSALLAEFAAEQIEDVKQYDARILGREPKVTVAVDGRRGAPLASVKPQGVIVATFDIDNVEALTWIHQQLRLHSPVSEGFDPDPSVEYLDSHKLFADGKEISIDDPIKPATEFVFVNTTPYAKKIERGASSQAPDGVYQAVAVLAQPKFPGMDIRFEYHSGGAYARMPAIVVTPRGG